MNALFILALITEKCVECVRSNHAVKRGTDKGETYRGLPITWVHGILADLIKESCPATNRVHTLQLLDL